MTYPIPAAAFDDRLGFVGTSGSGKTYAAGTAVERLLSEKKRVVAVDPLGVWWGLRLLADGKTDSKFPVVIFGGPHADIPITAGAGALIGETVAGMAESCIVDLSELGTKSNERRFMLGFLEALYRNATGEPFHLIIDEADMFAPQKTTEPMLQSLVEQIVRRGRVKGFIPWLITQRPAVISKDVLSQVDGLIAMKLTASHDRDALGAWIEGQADRADEKRILGQLAGLQAGTGFVWIPGRQVLEFGTFPAKVTFDSSRTPKRGEKRVSRPLKPLDVEKLKGKLATVEQEAANSDPAKLRKRVAELEAALRKAPSNEAPKMNTADREAAEQAGYRNGFEAGRTRGFEDGVTNERNRMGKLVLDFASQFALETQSPIPAAPPAVRPAAPRPKIIPPAPNPTAPAASPGNLTGPQQKIVRSLSMWRAVGHDTPTKIMVATVAGYSPSSGGYANLLSQLRGAEVVDYPEAGKVRLLGDVMPMSREDGRDLLLSTLSNPQRKLFDALTHGEVSKTELAEATEYSPTSGGFANLLSQLRSMGLVEYPSQGRVGLNAWVFEVL